MTNKLRQQDSRIVVKKSKYEQMWRQRGIAIKYLRFRLAHDARLTEPDVDIPYDDYRSYNRTNPKRKGPSRLS